MASTRSQQADKDLNSLEELATKMLNMQQLMDSFQRRASISLLKLL